MTKLLTAACLHAVLSAAAYDQAVMALMADPEVTEDLFSVMSPGEHDRLGGGWMETQPVAVPCVMHATACLHSCGGSAAPLFSHPVARQAALMQLACFSSRSGSGFTLSHSSHGVDGFSVCWVSCPAGDASLRNIPALAWSLISTPSNAERLDGFAFQKLSKQR